MFKTQGGPKQPQENPRDLSGAHKYAHSENRVKSKVTIFTPTILSNNKPEKRVCRKTPRQAKNSSCLPISRFQPRSLHVWFVPRLTAGRETAARDFPPPQPTAGGVRVEAETHGPFYMQGEAERFSQQETIRRLKRASCLNSETL